MKLNPDCIRDVLLYLEENLYIEEGHKFSKIDLKQLNEALSQYDKDDIFYSVYNLHQIGYIKGKINDLNDKKMFFCEIENITWNGHQFLNTIRPQNVWDATKKGAKKLGIMSIHALSSIAMKIADTIVTDPSIIAKIIESMKF